MNVYGSSSTSTITLFNGKQSFRYISLSKPGKRVTSLVLTHPITNMKARTRTAYQLVKVAKELRGMHNYSGLRAVVCGIMNATVEGDEMINMLKDTEYKDSWKSLKSYIILMSSSKGHRHYRTAFSNVVCGVIPES